MSNKGQNMETKTIHLLTPGEVTLESQILPPLEKNQLRVKTLLTAVSMGTERLVLSGKVNAPNSVNLRDNQPSKVPFGYQNVGIVTEVGPETDPKVIGRRIFTLTPHTPYFQVAAEDSWPVPADVSNEQAAFAANMETAVTLVLDGAPLIGERIAIFGFGMIGLCTALILKKGDQFQLDIYEPDAGRAALATKLGFNVNPVPTEPYDLLFELTGQQSTLSAAVEHACFTGRIIIGSWYPDEAVAVKLGTHFHSKRISLLSSQVSSFGSHWAQRFDTKRRRALAMSYVAEIPHQLLPSRHFSMRDAKDAYFLLQDDANKEQIFFTYP